MPRNLLQFLNSSHYREITLSMTRNLLQFLNSSISKQLVQNQNVIKENNGTRAILFSLLSIFNIAIR
jgi:hypothetical protein